MTRILPSIALLAVFTACDGNSYNQGIDPKVDDSGMSEADADTDADADGDTDADSDSDADTDVQWAGDCGNYWEPVDLSNWSRSYTVVYDGQAGTETHTGYGEVSEGRYRYDLNLSISSGDGYAGEILVDCDPQGNEGLYIAEWTMDYYMGGSPLATIHGTHDANRMYFPDESVVPGIGSWSYDYNLRADANMGDSGGNFPIDIAVSGNYVELGHVDVTVDGQAVSGYRLTNTYTMSSDGGGFSPFERIGYVDQTWVRGVGLVSEVHTWDMQDGSSHSMEKSLSAFTALSVIPD